MKNQDARYLKIGDVVFERIHGRLVRVITITRTTDTLAISGNMRFDKKTTRGFVRVFGGTSGLPYQYLESTVELKKEWRLNIATEIIRNANLAALPIQRVEAIAALCNR